MKFKGTFVSDLSGSLGGLVASRNKAGGFLRAKVTPTNPQTDVQMANRSAFASAGSSYHSLSPTAKAQWNQFAVNDFTPRNGRIPGVTYSGQQAFTALMATVNRSNQLIRETEFGNNTIALANFAFQPTPPTGQMSARIEGSTGTYPSNGLPIELRAAALAPDGTLNSIIRIGDGISDPTIAGDLRTVGDNSQRVGINYYVSQKGGQQQGLNYGGKLSLIGSTGLITVPSGPAVTGNAIAVNFISTDLDITGRKTWFTSGEFVQIHAFLVGANGQSQPIGTVTAQVD